MQRARAKYCPTRSFLRDSLPGYVLVYDADCSMCTRFRNTVEFLDNHRNLSFASIDNAEQAGLLDSLPDVLRHSSFHLVLPSNEVESGAKALPTLIRLLPAGRHVLRLIVSFPKGRELLGFLYSILARRHEAGLCKLSNASDQLSSGLRNSDRARLADHASGSDLSVSVY